MPKLMFMAGLDYEKHMAGRTQMEFEHRAMTLASMAEPGSTFHRCVPHFLKTFERLDEVKQLITEYYTTTQTTTY